MALTEENGGGIPATMLVGPSQMYGNGGGFGFGGDWGWIILLLLFAGGGNFGMGGMGGGLYPWLNNSNQINDVLAATSAAVNGAQTAVTQQLYTNQIADMERSFAAQTANTQALSALQAQLAQCCCDNRLATEQLRATVAQENCADREALNYATRDIINSQTAGVQRILDQMCADKIDAKNEKIADLERQLTLANLAASQGAQTARILADNAAQTTALEQYLAPTPRPAYVVQNPNCCVQNTCGCMG